MCGDVLPTSALSRGPRVLSFFSPLLFFFFFDSVPADGAIEKKKKNVSDHTEQLEHAGEVCEVSAGRHCRLCLAKACQQIFQHFKPRLPKEKLPDKVVSPWLKKILVKQESFTLYPVQVLM